MPEIGKKHHTTHEDGGNDEMDLTGLSGAATIEDTPVNGHTAEGISSNWAFDENVTLRALIEATLPWTIFISLFGTPKSQTNWNTIGTEAAQPFNGHNNASGTQDAEIAWDVVLAAGTWTIEILCMTYVDQGIYSVQFDSVEKGTLDAYSANLTYKVRLSLSGVVVPLTKKIELKLKMATKNESSQSYQARTTAIFLTRTA